MSTIATASPAANVMTFVFPVALFVGIVVWGYFQRTRR